MCKLEETCLVSPAAQLDQPFLEDVSSCPKSPSFSNNLLGCLWGGGVPLSALLQHREGALLSLGTSQGRVLTFVAG